MTKLIVGTFERDHDPIFKKLRHTTNTLRHVLHGNVSLLKVIVGIVDNDGNTLPEFPVKIFGDLRVSFFYRF